MGDEFMGMTAISRLLGGRSRSTVRLWMLSGRIPSVIVAGRRVAHRSDVERVRVELEREPSLACTKCGLLWSSSIHDPSPRINPPGTGGHAFTRRPRR